MNVAPPKNYIWRQADSSKFIHILAIFLIKNNSSKFKTNYHIWNWRRIFCRYILRSRGLIALFVPELNATLPWPPRQLGGAARAAWASLAPCLHPRSISFVLDVVGVGVLWVAMGFSWSPWVLVWVIFLQKQHRSFLHTHLCFSDDPQTSSRGWGFHKLQ
jgi:hypothetical protein